MTKEQAFDLFMAGFYCSGEGFNGEYTRKGVKPDELLRRDFEAEWTKIETGEYPK